MRRSRRPIIIASRPSPLAKAQAQAVGNALANLHQGVPVKYLWIESDGDTATPPNAAAGIKGLFTKAVDQAVADERADLAVHSLKDVPVSGSIVGYSGQLKIIAIPRRGDVRDCLVSQSATDLNQLPQQSTVATSSPRRAAQLRRFRPDLSIRAIRGNVGTRINKVIHDKEFDATLLAVAGLQRAGLAEHANQPIDPEIILPAAGQAALALQCRADDHLTTTRCLPLNHAASNTAVTAERTIVAGLAGNCDSPIAALAQFVETENSLQFQLHARVLSPDGKQLAEARESDEPRRLKHVVARTLQSLQDAGAQDFLQA